MLRLQLRLLHGMLRLAAESLIVTVLVLISLIQSLCLTCWGDGGIKVEHLKKRRRQISLAHKAKSSGSLGPYRLHRLEWGSIDVDAAAVRSFGNGLENLCLR